jgi:hypothetical protein
MELRLVRNQYSPASTLGELHVDGRFECFTLEDRVRSAKVPGATAIPPGRYEVSVTWSNRFKRPLPLLMNVPNYDGVRIHTGNKAEDTEGCILVGRKRLADFVGESKVAFEPLFQKIEDALRREKVFVEILQDGAPSELLARARGGARPRRAAPKKATGRGKAVGRRGSAGAAGRPAKKKKRPRSR